MQQSLRKLIRASFLLLLGADLSAQTYTGTGGAIPDVTVSLFSLNVTGLNPATIDTSVFGLETVRINLMHTYDSDLEIKLIAPDGTPVMLTAGNGGAGQNYINTIFDENAASSIGQGSAPFTGIFRPQGRLGSVNNGQVGNGTWTLRINDMVGGDYGNLIDWSITFGNNPASQGVFTSSNLPLIFITTTNNTSIPDEPKLMADMGIVYNGPGNRNYLSDPRNHYMGKIGIESRGSSSQMFPKRPYGFELWDVNGNAIDSSLLGMPSESDWILGPSYSDKTMLHNPLSYTLAQHTGHYATRFVFAEVFINGEYQGVYALTEKIKRDNNRVDIAKLLPTEISGDDLTGGYIIKVDKTTGAGGTGWYSNYLSSANASIYLQYEYPDETVIVPQQQQYIRAYVDSFETALHNLQFDTVTGYRRFFGLNSAVDYFIVTELSKVVDGYRISTFLHKDKFSNGGKLKMGPVWDYDIGYHNANYCQGELPTGWQYQNNNICGGGQWDIPFWWEYMMQDSNFTNRLKCRWTELRQTVLSTAWLDNWIDSMATYLNEAQQRNFEQWPILGQYVWPNPSPIPLTYQEEIDTLKSWIHQRIAWLDANMPGSINGCNLTSVNDDNIVSSPLTVYPNPASREVKLLYEITTITNVHITLRDLTGRTVLVPLSLQQTPGPQTVTLDLGSLAPGIYIADVDRGYSHLQQCIIKTN